MRSFKRLYEWFKNLFIDNDCPIIMGKEEDDGRTRFLAKVKQIRREK